ncbi:FkbM family methyltransferase [uncultured Methylobacterium sp.]|uniref:FkbM family methyltransferase n=1 Tax=uncultured Methylobacterium sp. TaxID=157278 RepID=UPI0035CB0CD8
MSENAYLLYSQFGEDLVMDLIFCDHRKPGFYFDIVAHDSQRFSNTQLSYKRGWRAINREDDKNIIEVFKLARSENISISTLLSHKVDALKFNWFSEAAVKRTSDQKSSKYSLQRPIVSSKQITPRRLQDVLSDHVSPHRQIDCLSVDVEGADFQVLKGNDSERFKPDILIVEGDGQDLMNAGAHPSVAYLAGQGYRLKHVIHVSASFIRQG